MTILNYIFVFSGVLADDERILSTRINLINNIGEIYNENIIRNKVWFDKINRLIKI